MGAGVLNSYHKSTCEMLSLLARLDIQDAS